MNKFIPFLDFPPEVRKIICVTDAIEITLTKGSGEVAWQSTLATIDADQHGTKTPVTGLGDKAEGDGLELAVASGDHIIDIREADFTGAPGWPHSIALAKDIIAGLH